MKNSRCLETIYWHLIEKRFCYDESIALYEEPEEPSVIKEEKNNNMFDNMAFYDSVAIIAGRSIVTIDPTPRGPKQPAVIVKQPTKSLRWVSEEHLENEANEQKLEGANRNSSAAKLEDVLDGKPLIMNDNSKNPTLNDNSLNQNEGGMRLDENPFFKNVNFSQNGHFDFNSRVNANFENSSSENKKSENLKMTNTNQENVNTENKNYEIANADEENTKNANSKYRNSESANSEPRNSETVNHENAKFKNLNSRNENSENVKSTLTNSGNSNSQNSQNAKEQNSEEKTAIITNANENNSIETLKPGLSTANLKGNLAVSLPHLPDGATRHIPDENLLKPEQPIKLRKKSLKERRMSKCASLNFDHRLEIPVIRQSSVPKFYLDTPDVHQQESSILRSPSVTLSSPVKPKIGEFTYDLKSVVEMERERQRESKSSIPVHKENSMKGQKFSQMKQRLIPLVKRHASANNLPNSVHHM